MERVADSGEREVQLPHQSPAAYQECAGGVCGIAMALVPGRKVASQRDTDDTAAPRRNGTLRGQNLFSSRVGPKNSVLNGGASEVTTPVTFILQMKLFSSALTDRSYYFSKRASSVEQIPWSHSHCISRS